MRSVLRWCVVPLLATTLLAQTAAKPKRKKTVARAAVTAADVQALKDALAAQQQQIEQLRQAMQSRDAALQQAQQQAQQAQQQLQQAQAASAEAQQKASSAETAANEQKETVTRLNTDLADVKTTLTNNAVSTQDEQKRMSALEGLVGRFRFTGDVRVRGENFTQDGVPDRNRARLRVRFGFDGKLNEDFTSGIYLATGSLGDPTTTNETLTNFFDRKTIALDKAWITYNPVAHKWVSLTAGKFAYLWQRTSVTGDPDLNPEGFDQKFSWDLRTPFVKNFTIQGIELLYNESNSGSTAKARQDSYALGGQVSAKLQMGPWTATPSFLSLKWNRPDAILQASGFATQATTTGSDVPVVPPATGVPTLPVTGEGPGCQTVLGGPKFPPCVFAPNGMTNATFLSLTSTGVPVPHFYSGFNYADFILNNQIKTPLARLPINLLLEFEDNLDAESHPLDATGKVMPGLGSQNKEYGADFNVGQLKNKNDIQIGYAWLRQEQDSVLASFAESDQRAPTNILQHRIYALWKLRSNTVAGFTWYRGRTLNTNLENAVKATGVKVGQVEPYLNRLQFDLIYTF
ncbi:MAG: hypothetical protein DMG88_07295 [Acidobacteria bacterium]|nr:MAG: hypothetical protein DMG88_07295 [Acidobacteriota bacterium]